ncbi:MAG: 50S ribosomal protein L9 [Deltaproteobacteria bacterium]|jgi:large subunit ribosomal protein L9|nr:50S ribosomal protein L9 [Deltaproteobacteria bacterium]
MIEIILTQDVSALGMAGQVLKVSPGYARNYLLPRSYALPATPGNLKRLAKKRAEFDERSRAEKENALAFKKSLEALTLTVVRKSVEKGKLYGAVTPQDIVDAAAAEGVTLDRRRLKITEPVKSIGDYEIAVRLHPEVSGTFRLKVMAEKEPEPPAPPAEPEIARRGRRPRSEEAEGTSPMASPDDAPQSEAGQAVAAEAASAGTPEAEPAPAEDAQTEPAPAEAAQTEPAPVEAAQAEDMQPEAEAADERPSE